MRLAAGLLVGIFLFGGIAEAKRYPTPDIPLVNACFGNDLLYRGTMLGLPPNQMSYASVVDNLKQSKVKGAKKAGRKMGRANTVAQQISAIPATQRYCVKVLPDFPPGV